MCVGVMGSALASPLYPLYQASWLLQTSDITGIYVAYMYGTLACLLFLGQLSNRFGFLRVLRAGLMLMVLGLLMSALAWARGPFVASRVVIGVASGLIMTSASLGLTQLSRGDSGSNSSGNVLRASAMTSFAMALGFGMGPLVSGMIAQWLPRPLVTAYVPNLVLGLLAIYVLYQVQVPAVAPLARKLGASSLRDWMPRITIPRPEVRRPFLVACLGAFSAFGIFGLYASLAPSFIRQMLPWHGPAVSGLSIAMILFLSAAVQWFARPLHTKTCAIWGLAMLALCNVLLMATTYTHWPLLFVLSVMATSAGHGLANLAGVAIVNKIAGPENRAALLSTYLVVGYLGTLVPILALGWLSDVLGLTAAIEIFCAAMALLTASMAVVTRRTPVIAMPGVSAASTAAAA
jgi:MFS family permease